MKVFSLSYVATAVVLLGLDSIWLSVTASRLYRPLLGNLLVEGFSVLPAALFYLLYVAGVVVFAVLPAFATGRWTTAASQGAFLGLVAYATYDLTNQATLRDWPIAITIADMIWGTVLSASAATIGYLIARQMTRII